MGLENTPPNLPLWPDSMTPEELKQRQAREHAFSESLMAVLSPTRWRFGHGSMFRDESGWYVANLPKLDVDAVLDSLGKLGSGPSDERTLALYLSILRGDFETAIDLTRVDLPDGSSGDDQAENLPFIQRGRETLSIYDKTRDWLANQKRKNLRLIQ